MTEIASNLFAIFAIVVLGFAGIAVLFLIMDSFYNPSPTVIEDDSDIPEGLKPYLTEEEQKLPRATMYISPEGCQYRKREEMLRDPVVIARMRRMNEAFKRIEES